MATQNNYYNNNNYNNNEEHNKIYPNANWNNRKIMDVANQGLTTLPPIPDDTIELYCQNNQLTSLPKLPKTLRILNCSNNQLTSLPTLPANMRYLDFQNNQVYEFPKIDNIGSESLPYNLRVLICGNNRLTRIPSDGAENLQHISCENNQITEIPVLDDIEIQYVNFDNNPLLPAYENIYKDFKSRSDDNALQDFAEETQELYDVKLTKISMLKNKFRKNFKKTNKKNKLKELYKYKRLFSRKPGPQNNTFVNTNIQNILASYATGITGKTMEQQQNILAKHIPQVQRYGVSINPKQYPFNKTNRTRLSKLLKEEKKYNEIGKQFEAKQGGRKTRKNRNH
jgi:hypothetical protein